MNNDELDSILNKSIIELENMDIKEVKEKFMNEILSLQDLNKELQVEQLRKIFNHIFSFQPTDLTDKADIRLQTQEHRIFADLITIPELYEIDYVIDFIKHDNGCDYDKMQLFYEIFNFYETHSPEAINNFNYIFRSSASFSVQLLKNPAIFRDDIFSDRILTAFNKETLSQLYRFYYYTEDPLNFLAREENCEQLFIISQLSKIVYLQTNHSSEFLYSVFRLIEDDSFNKLLKDYYDVLVHGDEESFKNKIFSDDPPIEMLQLMNYIIQFEYDNEAAIVLGKDVDTLDKFMQKVKKRRWNNNEIILGENASQKMSFSLLSENDFKTINDAKNLEKFKEAILENVYGISVKEAINFKYNYGQSMRELRDGIVAKDENIYEMLKAIITILDLDMNDEEIQSEIRVIQKGYYNMIREKGITYQNNYASATIVEACLNRMIINTYNKCNINLENSDLLTYDDGVKILDAGLNFDMIITSLDGSDDFYSSDLNMKSKWLTAEFDDHQGLCTSHISSQNLGVISLDSPMLGFSNIPEYSLNAMGPNDIFSVVDSFNLRFANKNDNFAGDVVNRIFFPSNVMSSKSRYGYNELLLDRFLLDDKNDEIKLMPSYVPFYKFDENYQDTRLYIESLKLAKDFNIPIVIIDVKKIRDNEKAIIEEKENELLSQNYLDEELLREIITRYMNNHTGYLTPIGTKSVNFTLEDDFTISGLENLFDKIFDKILSIKNLEDMKSWYSVIADVYNDEHEKYRKAVDGGFWNFSVNEFVLDNDKYGIKTELQRIRDYIQNEEKGEIDTLESENKYQKFIPDNELDAKVDVIINFLSFLRVGSEIEIKDFNLNDITGKLVTVNATENIPESIAENLIIGYFFENCHDLIVNSLFNNDFRIDDIKTKSTDDFDFVKEVKESNFYSLLNSDSSNYIGYDDKYINNFVDAIDKMSEGDFLFFFNPYIDEMSRTNDEDYIAVADRMLTRKNNIRNEFNKLNQLLNDKEIANYKKNR